MKVNFNEGSYINMDCKNRRLKVICKGIGDGGVYRLIASVTNHEALMHDGGTLLELRHRRFGHLNLDSLRRFKK